MSRRTALTGTPGTGKSSVARRLIGERSVAEVADLARRYRAYDGGALSGEVDLARLRSGFRADRSDPAPEVVVGHLAHLLPLRDVVMLRCHPIELDRRLARAGTPADARRANVVAEALDFILVEALELRRRVWEVDTTGRGVSEVVEEVGMLLRRRPPPAWGTVDWLADPRVTDQLLRQGS